MRYRTRLILMAVVCSIVIGVGCGGSSSSSSAQLRIMNASPAQQDLNLLLDNNSVETGVVYDSATAYASEPSGNHTALIEQSGSNTSLVTQAVTLNAGAYYTILAVEPSFNSSSLNLTLLTDDNSAPSSGNMKLRIINASPDLGNFDAYVVAPGASISTAAPTVSNLTFQSASAYATLAPGNYEVFITPPNQKAISVDSGELTFSANQIRTLVVLDNVGGGYAASLISDLN